MQNKQAAFRCTYSNNIPKLLEKLSCSVAISTYQAGKVIFIGSENGETLVQLPRNFDKAMGIGVSGQKMIIATRDRVHILANDSRLAASYPDKPYIYDALYLPRSTYYTGLVDIHDVHLSPSKVFAVNTSFSCIVELDDNFSWKPVWSPPQIDAIASEDRCHLNGLAVNEQGEPMYATALGQGNSFQSWRQNIPNGGILYDIPNNTIISGDLKMPHSPRLYENRLFLLESALGHIVEYKAKDKSFEIIAKIPAFTRGLAIYKDFLFVGKSQLRTSSSIFKDLDIGKNNIHAGICIIHLPSRKVVGEINYVNSVEEIYDVQILPNTLRPNVLNPDGQLSKYAISTPSSTFWARSKKNE